MIIDVGRFVRQERPYWQELEAVLDRMERDAAYSMNLEEAQRFHYLYRRAGSDYAKLSTFAFEPALKARLESLISRAYTEIHETRRPERIRGVVRFFTRTFPRTVRARWKETAAIWLICLAGFMFGAAVVVYDYDSKAYLIPFTYLHGDPSERVAMEESASVDRVGSVKSTFSATLMQNNIRVTITAAALGLTFGIGTLAIIFGTGVMLGAVAMDYVMAGETAFLFGWLLPHGSFEIPAALFGGAGGLVLARAQIGWGQEAGFRSRLRDVGPDLLTLIIGAAAMLVWAGIVEAFFSQYHEPAIPYFVKIAFGMAEVILLSAYFLFAGRKPDEHESVKIEQDSRRA